ncbi:hypothetical protein BC351_10670 [Paenibacillus ferrarius]|uniref:Uncharacterized protein n=1 Tax=Paenibacillus ferrarius TaxID=1469647 RepID=A0A1V4H8U8_9BACL|nr:hypothetical protein BC351_10670 [Paenibacillus ferrarius]
MLNRIKRIFVNKEINHLFGIMLLLLSAELASNANVYFNVIPLVAVCTLIWSLFRFSFTCTKFVFSLVTLHYSFYILGKISIKYQQHDVNKFIVLTFSVFVLYIVFLNILFRTRKATILIKFAFYILIAFFTFAIAFNIGPFDLGIDCNEKATYELFQKCKKSFSQFDLLKANLINVLVIGISIFEAISNGFDFFKKNKTQNIAE